MPRDESRRVPSLAGYLALALTLGFLGFGGGYAVALRVKRAVVEDRRWLDEDAFMETLAVAISLPGATATNLVTMLGYRFAGVRGALAGVLTFLAPSLGSMVAFGAFYGSVRNLTSVGWLLDGMGMATVGVVLAVAAHMRPIGVKGTLGWVLAAGGAVLLVVGALNLLEVVLASGLVGALFLRPPAPDADDLTPPTSLRGLALVLPALATLPVWAELFFVFARIGVATFGGGIAMISPMEHEIVGVRGWISARAFGDAIVLGQITPGPIAISATFIGYRVAGLAGAAVATAGMFGPAFVLSVVAARSMPAFRDNPVVRGFLAGIAPAIVGAIAAASVALFRTTVHGPFGAGVAFVSFAVLVWRPKLSPLAPIAVGGALELLFRLR